MKMRKVGWVVLAVLIVIVVVAVVTVAMIDSIAKTAVEKGGEYALRVDTRVDDMDVSLLGGRVVMDGLNISNPEGFTSDHLLHSGRFDLEVDPGSLLSETVVVRHFKLDGLDLNIEQTLKGNNVSKILDNAKRLGKSKDKDQPADEEGGGKKVQVDTILITNVAAHFHLPVKGAVTVKVPEIKLEKVSSEDSGGVVLSQLIARILPSILIAVVEQSKGVVPADFLKGFDAQVADAATTMGVQVDAIRQQAREQMAKLAKEAGKAAEKGKEGVEKGAEAVKDLLGGKKKEETKAE